MADVDLSAELEQLHALHRRSLITADQLKKSTTDALSDARDRRRLSSGLPPAGFGQTGLPDNAYSTFVTVQSGAMLQQGGVGTQQGGVGQLQQGAGQPASAQQPPPPLAGGAAPGALAAPPPTTETKRDIVVMFCDIQDSTKISTQLEPEDVRMVVSTFQRVLGEVLHSLRGHIAQFLGDGIMAYFNYPEIDADRFEHAVRAGLEMIKSLPRINRELVAAGLKLDPPLRMRIGLHSGTCVMSQMTGGNHAEQLALGEVPNIAARMESLSPTNCCAMTPAVTSMVEHKFKFKLLLGDDEAHVGEGRWYVKGIAEPIEVFTVEGERDERPGRARNLVGREAEMASLQTVYDGIMLGAGAGHAVIATGPSGIGKTALVAGFAQQLRGEPLVLFVKACEHRKSTPLYTAGQLLRAVLEQACSIENEGSNGGAHNWAVMRSAVNAKDTIRKALELVGLGGRADELLEPLLDVLELDGELTTAKWSSVDSKLAILALVAALSRSRERAVMIVVQRADQLDHRSLEVFDELVRGELQQLRMLLVMNFRTAADLEPIPAGSCRAAWLKSGIATHAPVARMPDADAKAMAVAVADGKGLPADVLSHIVKHGDGVPLHLEQLTRSVLAAGVMKLNDDESAYSLTGAMATIALPSSLEDAVSRNLEVMFVEDANTKLLVELTAVLGGAVTEGQSARLWAELEKPDKARMQAVRLLLRKKIFTSLTSSKPSSRAIGRAESMDAMSRSTNSHGHSSASAKLSSSSQSGESSRVFSFVDERVLHIFRSKLMLTTRERELRSLSFVVLSAADVEPPTDPVVLAKLAASMKAYKQSARLYNEAREQAMKRSFFDVAMQHGLDGLSMLDEAEDDDDKEMADVKSHWFALKAVMIAWIVKVGKEQVAAIEKYVKGFSLDSLDKLQAVLDSMLDLVGGVMPVLHKHKGGFDADLDSMTSKLPGAARISRGAKAKVQALVRLQSSTRKNSWQSTSTDDDNESASGLSRTSHGSMSSLSRTSQQCTSTSSLSRTGSLKSRDYEDQGPASPPAGL